MGMRFRKSINLGGGFRINISKSGIGYSWGFPGYRITKTAKGTVRKTTSIPGTGISWVEEHKIEQKKVNVNTTKRIDNGGKRHKSRISLLIGIIVLLFAAIIGNSECQHESIIAATCETNAICKKCRASMAPALGHDYEIVNSVSSTCETPGTKYFVCNRCDVENTETISSAFGHDYEIINTVVPTCQTPGTTYFECSICGEKSTETIDVIDHQGTETVLKEPTLLEEGKKQFKCDLCGQITETALDPLSLSPDNPIVLTAKELLTAVESDIDKANELYKGKWLQLSGKVVSVVHKDVSLITRDEFWMEEPISYTIGNEVFYEIEGIRVQSPLIYWLAINKRFEHADIIVEMDIALCAPEGGTEYKYYSQNSTATVVAYCAAIGEKDIVLTDGRYPPQ